MPGQHISYFGLPVVGTGLHGNEQTRTDSRGTLSFISAASVVWAAQQAQNGAMVPLTLEGDQTDTMTWASLAAVVDDEQPSRDGLPLAGTNHWRDLGTAGRGVILDLRGANEGPISAGDLQSAVRGTGVALGRGDVIFLHTGWLDRFLNNPSTSPPLTWLAADHDMAQFLWDTGISAVGTDGPRTERRGNQGLDRPLSYSLGLAELELLQLGRLADMYELHHRYDFLFIANPTQGSARKNSPVFLTAIL